MNEILTSVITALALLAGLAALVLWARRDVFAARPTYIPDGYAEAETRRPAPSGVPAQRTRQTAEVDDLPTTYESQATTATA